MITVTRVAQPAVEPVLLEDVLAWASVGVDDMIAGTVDTRARELVRELLPEQREAVERYTGCVLAAGTFVVTFDLEDVVSRGSRRLHPLTSPGIFPFFSGSSMGLSMRSELEIPMRPVLTVTKVTATDINGADTTVDPLTYFVIAGEYPKVTLRPGCTWGAVLRNEACLKVECTAGYGTTSGPSQQTSTDTETAIAATETEVLGSPVRFGLEVVSGNAVDFTVYGADKSDWTDEVLVSGPTTVNVGLSNHLAIGAPPKAWYRVKIKSTATGKAGQAVVSGVLGSIPGALLVAVRELVRYHFVHRGDQMFVGTGGFKGVAPPPDAIFKKIDSYRFPVVA